MNINLASVDFNTLSLHITLGIKWDDVENEVGEYGFNLREQKHYVQLAAFRKAGQDYRVLADIRLNVKREPVLNLTYYHLDAENSRTPNLLRTHLGNIRRFLDHWTEAPCTVMCYTSYVVATDRYRPIIALPVIRLTTPGLPFNEIRGVRLVKLEEGVEKDSVFLDMVEESSIHLLVQTAFDTSLSSRLPADALARLVALKDRSVIAIEPDSGE